MSKLYITWFFVFLIDSPLECATLEVANTTNNCSTLKDNLAEALSNFTLCSINYSRPITLCKDCLDNYINLQEKFNNLSEVIVEGEACLYYYINLDRLQILLTQYTNAVNLWERAKCYECYLVENGVQTNHESEVTKQFDTYYKNYNTCAQNNESLCRMCMKDYTALSEYYKSASNANERIGICIDLEDLMNITWTLWGTTCCKYRRHNEYAFIGSTVAVFIITVSFYIAVQFCGEKRAPTIIQQSRFAESVNRLP